MNQSREQLLQPTLGQDAPPSAAPYSIQSTLFTGIFGGPFAALALIGLNSSRLQRLGRDVPALAACFLAVVLTAWILHGPGVGAALPVREWLASALGKGRSTYIYRLLSLLIVGVGYLLHRREQRNTDLLGLSRPNGWIGGTVCVLIGAVILAACVASVAALKN